MSGWENQSERKGGAQTNAVVFLECQRCPRKRFTVVRCFHESNRNFVCNIFVDPNFKGPAEKEDTHTAYTTYWTLCSTGFNRNLSNIIHKIRQNTNNSHKKQTANHSKTCQIYAWVTFFCPYDIPCIRTSTIILPSPDRGARNVLRRLSRPLPGRRLHASFQAFPQGNGGNGSHRRRRGPLLNETCRGTVDHSTSRRRRRGSGRDLRHSDQPIR